MGKKITVNNIEVLKECIEKMQSVNVTEQESGDDIEFKYVNIENLTLRAWKRRFKGKDSPIFSFVENEKYGQTFLTLNVYQCIEKEKELETI